MKGKLLNFIMNDKSRKFAELLENCDWEVLRFHLEKLREIQVTDYITDNITTVWIDFNYKNQRFSINNQYGEYWFFSQNPVCPEEILIEIVEYCEELLMK